MTEYGMHIATADHGASMRLVRAAEAVHVDALWAGEFFFTSATVKLAAWAGATTHCKLGSAIMYGVGRSPLVIAAEARDLDEISGGRLILGLGTGTKRMMSSWHGETDVEAPAQRMEELVPLVRQLLRLDTGPVEHRGRYYTVDMTATAPAPPPVRESIPIYTAGVRPRMIETAGRVADGLVGHPLFSARYVQDVVRPAIVRGADRAGRDAASVSVMSMVICAVHDDEEQARREAAQQIAFYSSVGGYAPLLNESGFAQEGETIRTAFRAGDFPAMFAAVNDQMIDEMAVTGTSAQVAKGLSRYDGVLDHVALYSPSVGIDPARVEENIASLIELYPLLKTTH